MSIRLISNEQEELVLKNQRLVHYYVQRLGIFPNDSKYEDMISIGTIGLIKAAATFDKSKNIKFSTYATPCINNELFMYFRKEKAHANDISFEDQISVDHEGNELTLSDIIPSSDKDFTEEIANRESFIKFISIVLNLLESRERLIILYEISGATQEIIAEKFNITQSYISRLIKKLHKKVKSYFTSTKQFNEFFSMAIVGDFYQISFALEEIKDFNKIFATLQNLNCTEDFKVNCSRERIIIQVPAKLESFYFIAQIIQEIDNYSMAFVSKENKLSTNNNNFQEMKTNDANGNKMMKEDKNSMTEGNSVEEPKETVGNSNIQDSVSDLTEVSTSLIEKENSQVNQVIDYMLSIDSFTVIGLKQHFPNLTYITITKVLSLAKTKGIIEHIGVGKYKVIKN